MRERKIELPTEVPAESVIGYARIFQLEYWFRELAYLELKAHFGENWLKEAERALKGSRGITAEQSLSNDKRHPHMATPENDPLWFLPLEGLLRIIFDETLWPVFEPYLTTKELLQAKFTEIMPIRNRIGHNRGLHEDDLDRLRRVLRDLDQGFWRFCTSFNDTQPFIADRRSDAVYSHFQDRMGFDYKEIQPGKWALVGSTLGLSQNVSVEYSFRPSADRSGFPAKGRLYHLTFSHTAHHERFMNYPDILKYTQRHHHQVVYIILDSFQKSLRVSVPALYPAETIIEAGERFYYATGNMYSPGRIAPTTKSDVAFDYDATLRPFEAIAAQWPHFVLPPGHAFEVLGPDCPCSIFEA